MKCVIVIVHHGLVQVLLEAYCEFILILILYVVLLFIVLELAEGLVNQDGVA